MHATLNYIIPMEHEECSALAMEHPQLARTRISRQAMGRQNRQKTKIFASVWGQATSVWCEAKIVTPDCFRKISRAIRSRKNSPD